MEGILIYSSVAVVALLIILTNVVSFRHQQRIDLARRDDADVGAPMAQYPQVDDDLCLGCGSCVRVCPEGDVLGMIYGKAALLNPLRCVGHGACADACPVGAISIGIHNLHLRDDIPLLNDDQQTNIPGIYVAGELGGISLVHNAVNGGRRAIEKIAATDRRSRNKKIKDVIIIGAGPAGLSAALTAVEHGLSAQILEQYEIGGSIRMFAKRAMVMVQPVDMPLYGRLNDAEYSKEFLLELWQDSIKRHKLDILSHQQVKRISWENDAFKVESANTSVYGNHVVLALGRRGTPRKLNVPGETMEKVSYDLSDAGDYQNKNILVVGGGDSAVQAAMMLGKQTGNRVAISYRKEKFLRIKKKNEERINESIAIGQVMPIYNSNLLEVKEQSVVLKTEQGVREMKNDFVFIMVGGIPPVKMLKEMGIQFGSAEKKRPNKTVMPSPSQYDGPMAMVS